MEQQLKSLIKSKPKSKYQKEVVDSSDISSMDEDDIDMLTNQDIEKKLQIHLYKMNCWTELQNI